MHSYIRGTGKHEESPVRIDPLKGLACRSCHVIAKKIMYPVMADLLSVYLMIKGFIILLAVGKPHHGLPDLENGRAAVLILHIAADQLPHPVNSLRCVEDGGLVHVIPEALDSLLGKETVLISKPSSRLRIQHIGKMGVSRPYRRHKIAAVLLLAEVSALFALLTDRISLLNLHARVNNGNQSDVLLLHLLHELRKVLKVFFVQSEILITLHIVNIHIDHVKGNLILAVSCGNLPEILLCPVAPPALSVPESKFRRDIASSDDPPELPDNVVSALALDHIQIQVRRLTGDLKQIRPGISDVKGEPCGIVHEKSEILPAGDHDKIVSRIQRPLVLRVLRIVRSRTDIAVSSLVDSPVCLPKTVDNIVLVHCKTIAKAFLKADLPARGHSLRYGNIRSHGLCLKGLSKLKLSDHTIFLLIRQNASRRFCRFLYRENI